MLFEQLNKFPRADELLRLSLEKSKALGPGNPQTIESLVQLGLLRGDQTSFKEGEQFIQQALDLAARSHPAPGDPQTLNAQSGMGKILAQSGAFDKGIPLLETLVRRPANNPEERVMLSDNLNALAFAYQNTGHYKDAEAVNRRALELDRTVHGDSHPKVAYDIFNIASINAVLGQYPQAEALFRNAAGILEHWYGQDHPETVQIQATVALMAMQNGEDAEAERLLKNVLPLQERIYGTNIQPAIAFTYDSLSKLALKRGRLSEAESDARQGAEINRKLFGEQDYRTAITVGNVASVLLKEGQFQEAEVIVRPAINALMAHPFPGNMSVGVTQITLGEALLGQKRYSEAILPLEAGYEMLKQKPGAFAAKLQDVRKDLAQIYDLLKQPEKAAKLHAEISRVKR
jgi:tetratricopeptide (TPR) repeat protein